MSDIDYRDQAGAILTALKRIIRANQEENTRPSPTKDEWLAIDRAIAATGFNVNADWSGTAADEWESTLKAALR
ncbi:Uncharacterised protein [Mycobacteroides abscessus subsp. abscessus]|uniref:hypothetical protein n=1 Tax=Mycobacteroides abscessus TaxID=36809 RepID=UPI0009A8D9A1|nr:hypothetical protein [Mycobacteroides abscessus]SKO35631.1 Uncharacterised protein [Mycobacteroides abscessus subsp. abscessus]